MGRALLGCAFKAPRVFRATLSLDVSQFKLNTRALKLCAASLQGDGVFNGTHCKKALLSDPQLFETQFDELLTELTERDFTDPGLTDALHRLKKVCFVVPVIFSNVVTGGLVVMRGVLDYR